MGAHSEPITRHASDVYWMVHNYKCDITEDVNDVYKINHI